MLWVRRRLVKREKFRDGAGDWGLGARGVLGDGDWVLGGQMICWQELMIF